MQQLTPDSLGNGRFVLERELGAGGMGIVYQALDRETDMRVALKTLRCVDMHNVRYFKREFRHLHDLVHPNLCSLMELIHDNGVWFFTMELISGVDFLSYVNKPAAGASHRDGGAVVQPGDLGRPSTGGTGLSSQESATAGELLFDEKKLRQCLIELCGGLDALHSVGKVHRDIKPSNVLINEENRLVLLDFGLVVEKGSLRQTEQQSLMGSAAYMAPEQAESSVAGPEADLYSVGVMLYQAMTQQLPFSGQPLKIILDKQMSAPKRAGEICSGLPTDLEELCDKLLDRDPGQRPTSKQIMEQLGASARIGTHSTVAVSTANTSGEVFVGRMSELQALTAALESTTHHRTPAVVSIDGVSGIGKSALAEHFTRLSLAIHADLVVLKGRCYEQESAPYKAFDGVIDHLVRYLRTLPLEEGDKLVPRNAELLIDLFPALQRSTQFAAIRRSKNEIEDALEMQNRAFGAVKTLLANIANQHPLIVFLDDMQRADADSIALFDHLVRGPDPAPIFFMLLGRSSRGDASPSWCVDRGALPGFTRLRLRSLDATESEELARFHINRGQLPLTVDPEEISTEADGHPLYIVELVRHIATGGGDWQNVRIEDVIWHRVQTVSEAGRRLLRIICVAGTPIKRGHLQDVAKMDSEEFFRTLGMLRVAKLIRTYGPKRHHLVEPYHGRVREAVVVHNIPSGEANQIHLDLARYYLSIFSEDEVEENIFLVTQHLFEGKELIKDREERQRLARLLHQAGKKSRSLAAFVSSLVYFKESIELFADESWEEEYQTTFDLYCSAAESAYNTGDFQLTRDLVDGAKARARSNLDRAKIYEIYVLSLAAEGKPHEAIDAAIGMISKLGVYLPRRLSRIYLVWKILTTKLKLFGKPVDRLRNLPLLDNANVAAVCRLVNRVSHTVFVSMPSLRGIVVIRLVELCLRYGVDQNMAASFALWGFMNSTLFGDFRGGYKYGRLSLDILKRLEEPGRSQLAVFTYATFLQHLKEPIRDTLPLLLESHERAYQTGDLPYYGWSGTIYCFHSFFAGKY